MYISPAKNRDKVLSRYEKGTRDDYELIFEMHQNSVKAYTENIDKIPSDDSYRKASLSIAEKLGVNVSLEQLKVILSLFPFARISLALDDQEFHLVHNAVCAYIFGSTVPTYGDKIDTERFYRHLAYQAERMGFEPVPDDE